MFDCLHDMGDPVGAARHVRERSPPDGTWMIVEPMAGDRVEDNLNPVGRAYYGVLARCSARRRRCRRRSGSRSARRPARRGSATSSTAGGFTRFRRVAETPFNLVFEARP